MESVEGQANQNVENVEGQEQQVDLNALMEQMEQLKSTNQRLLSESKQNADKYREIRDKYAAKEKLELEEKENWKERLDIEKNEKMELADKYNSLKKQTLQKDLKFNIAQMANGVPLNKGVTIDHVINEVLNTGMVEVSEDESGFVGLQDAFEKVKTDAVFLFDHKKAPMANAIPNNAPRKKSLKEMSGKELEMAMKDNIAKFLN